MAGRDITEGRSTRAIAVDVGIVSNNAIWQNTTEAYDIAIGGQPFFYAMNDQRPYVRETAPFRKEQFDNSSEPGEQSLTGWWIRSQSSFHNGQGIKFYDPSAGEIVNYRYTDGKGINVWTKGDVTLLNATTSGHVTTNPVESNGRAFQQLRSIQWTTSGTTYNGVLLHDGYDVDKIDSTGAETHFIDYNAAADDKVYAICDDGTTAFWVTNDTGPSGKLEVFKKNLDLNSTSAATSMFTQNGLTVTNATMEYVKERIVMCVNNSVYEFTSTTTSLPSVTYSHGDSDHIFTSITASGPAIYISGYGGIQSNIYKFTLVTSSGVMPTLSQAITAAEMPTGEIIHKIYYYLGYMMIGTSKGIRVAQVNDQDGSLQYGPLIVETSQPCYDFAARDSYVWCATSVGGEPGLIRIDLSAQIEPLVFAWANDVYYGGVSGVETTSCAFLGETDRIAFCTEAKSQFAVTTKARTSNVATLTTSVTHSITVGDTIYAIGVDSTFDGGPYTVTAATTNQISYTTATTGTIASTSATGFTGVAGFSYLEKESELMTSGYLTTGFIRYNTLEPKNFKRLLGRGDFGYGSLTLETVEKDGTEYDLISYGGTVAPVEVTTNQPADAQEYIAYKFIFYRDATDNTKGPIFQGYQGKATIATPRQRIIQFPVFNYDTETDRYNVQTGYEGRALDRLAALENLEQGGDVVTWQDLTTGESRQVVIEKISFTRETPPDKRFSGFGGVITMLIRTV
jgi:hypothetical protein